MKAINVAVISWDISLQNVQCDIEEKLGSVFIYLDSLDSSFVALYTARRWDNRASVFACVN